MTRIFVVEDHPVMLRGYASIIESEWDLTICGTTGSAKGARQRIREVEPDLVLLDLALEEGSGLSLIEDLQARHPDLPVLVVSMHDENIYARRALEAGAAGYLRKNEPATTVVKALRAVLDHGIYLSPELRNRIVTQMLDGGSGESQSPMESFSARELEVFTLMGRGLERSEIAGELNLSPKTVDTHRQSLKEKLSVDTAAQLWRRAVLWVELESV